jgi:polysaccharide biosynthesis transport protein
LTSDRQELIRPIEGYRPYNPGFAPDNPSGTTLGVDLRDIVSILMGKFLWLLLAMLVGGVLGVAASAVLPERYLAEGLLVIDTRELNIPEFQSIRSARTVEPWGGRSEGQVLASREMVSAVVTKLDLQHDPNYNSTLQDHPVFRWVSEVAWLPDSWREELRPAPEFGSRVQTRIVQQIIKNLTVLSEERSYAITVRYTGYNPIQSAKFLNDLIEYYLSQDVRAKSRAVDQARTELKQRLDFLYGDLEATRARIRSLEGQPGALETNQGTVTAQLTMAVGLERLRLAAEQGSVETDLAQLGSGLASNRISVTNEKLVTPRLKEL